MTNLDRDPYGGYPKFWSDKELDSLAIKAIRDEAALRERIAKASDEKRDGERRPAKVSHEAVRIVLESETRLMLLPIDDAIARVALIDEEGNVSLKPEIVKKLQELEK